MACGTCNSETGCGCVSNYKEKNFGFRMMWTLGGNSPAANVWVLDDDSLADIAPTIAQMQPTVTVMNASANFKCKVGFQLSADGATWDNPIYFGAPDYQVGNGTAVLAWYTGTTNYKRKIRFVVSAEQNGAANVIDMANVQLVIGFLIR